MSHGYLQADRLSSVRQRPMRLDCRKNRFSSSTLDTICRKQGTELIESVFKNIQVQVQLNINCSNVITVVEKFYNLLHLNRNKSFLIVEEKDS